ncbi:MAG: CRISPR system precrRNA processing endoribonuclease RAMP protein Cas6, partial [Desulfuromonadales bacterium]|nr:CRISPR system precrRNA processing endoribonuclease RAMP protein Cas6 [Desulfuromonadales bacterium]
PLRSYLPDIEFVEISFHYQLDIPQILPLFPELLLRSALHQAGLEILDPEPFERLLTPPLPDDPTALRRYQRPAPPFAFCPQPDHQTTTAVGQGVISCHLFGDGIELLDALVTTMAGIQPFVFANRPRQCQLTTVSAADAAGNVVTIWQKGQAKCIEPPRITAAWRFDTLPAATEWCLEFFTPARLLVQKKPLFRPALRHILPFILRRVTALCYFCNHIEITGATELLEMSAGIKEETGEWRWHDWRSHQGDGILSELGGVCGQLRLKGDLPDDLIDLLRLGSLMNIGKGAAYGAGAYRFTPVLHTQ